MNFSRSKSNDSSSTSATPTTTALMEWFPKATGFMLKKLACGCSGNINDHIIAEDDEHDMFDDVSVLDGRFYEGASRRYDQHAPGQMSESSLTSPSRFSQQQPVYHLSALSHDAPLNIHTSTSCSSSSNSRKTPVSPVPSYATASTCTMQTFEDVDIDDEHDQCHDHHHFHEEEEEEVQSTASTQVISHLLKQQTPLNKYSRRTPNVVTPDGDHQIPSSSGDAYRVLLRMPPRKLQFEPSSSQQQQQQQLPDPSLLSLPRNSNIRPRVRSTPARYNQRDVLGDAPPFPTMA